MKLHPTKRVEQLTRTKTTENHQVILAPKYTNISEQQQAEIGLHEAININ